MRFVHALVVVSLLSACTLSDRTSAPIVPQAAKVGTNQTVFFGTTRSKTPEGVYGIGRTGDVQLGQVDVSMPPGRTPGLITYGGDAPDPEIHFALAGRNEFGSSQAFQAALRHALDGYPRSERSVSLYVHGFNTSFAEAMFRIAQLKVDLKIPGAAVAYAWPSRANPVGYEYDEDSAIYARDGLEQLLSDVKNSGASDIVLVAHSMGSFLLLETLRQIERGDPGWTGRHISGVVLISPDLDIDVFKSQMGALETIPEPFVIFTSQRDRALNLSAFLTGEPERLGNLSDVSQLSELPVTLINVTELSDPRGVNHFVAGSSPTLIAMVSQARTLDRNFMRGQTNRTARVFNAESRFARNATELVIRPIN